MPLGSWPDCSIAWPIAPAARRIGGQCARILVGFNRSPNISRWRSNTGFRAGSPRSSVTSLMRGMSLPPSGERDDSPDRPARATDFFSCLPSSDLRRRSGAALVGPCANLRFLQPRPRRLDIAEELHGALGNGQDAEHAGELVVLVARHHDRQRAGPAELLYTAHAHRQLHDVVLGQVGLAMAAVEQAAITAGPRADHDIEIAV